MPLRLWVLVILTLSLATTGWDLDLDDPAVAQALVEIRPSGLRAHMRFLASDALEGRATGSRGHRIAAEYVAAQFEAIGLEPAGSSGGFFQTVPLRSAQVLEAESSLRLIIAGEARALESGVDYVLAPSFRTREAHVAAPVVFAGYGITAPGLRHDDYAHVDARGKLAVVFLGAPERFPSDQRAHYGSMGEKQRSAAAHGALGLLVAQPAALERAFPWKSMVARMRSGGMRWLDARGDPGDTPAGLRVGGALSRSGLVRLLGDAKDAVARAAAAAMVGRPQEITLAAEAEIHSVSRWEGIESVNVAGVLRGSDPELASESVVYTAHLDHVGIGEPVDGDAIYNGAYDNASGVAGLIELARAFVSLSPRPRRSVAFVAVTAEEHGLLGSDYFARHPTVPGGAIVANVNLDGLIMLYPSRDVVAYGAEHSSLSQIAEEAAARMGFELSPDPWPEQSLFVRSDHYSFVKQGIPSVYLLPGFESVVAGQEGSRLLRGWLGSLYHSPKDDMDQIMDFDAGARLARTSFLVGLAVASRVERPRWNAGDFFGDRFGPSRSPASRER